MFGFFGKTPNYITVESNGYSTGSTRDFDFYLIVNPQRPNTATLGGTFEFDIDNVSGTKPDQIYRQAILTSYGRESIPNIAGTYSLSANNGLWPTLDVYQLYSGFRNGWRYNAATVLSPATRKWKFSVFNPDELFAFNLLTQTNNQARTSTNNNYTGVLDLNLNQYKNLSRFIINEGWSSQINFKMDDMNCLDSFQLAEAVNLSTITGKLPTCVKYVILGESLLTNINSFISNAINVEALYFGRYAPAPGLANALSTLSGTLDINHMTSLREIALSTNNSLTTINMPSNALDWYSLYIVNLNQSTFATIDNQVLNDALASSNLRFFGIFNNKKVWSRSFTNADFSSNLTGFYTYQNSITGDITLNIAKPNLKDFRIGNSIINGSANQLNDHSNVDITGLTQATTIDLSGCEIDNLLLPVNTVLTTLNLIDNNLDTTVNTNLISQIVAMTALTTLRFSPNTTSALVVNHVGQDSTNGLGNNLDFSALVNMTEFTIASCKITGSLTLPNVNKLTVLNVAFNTGLTSIVNLTSHTSIVGIVAHGCTSLAFSITNVFTILSNIRGDNSLISSVDLSGKVSTNQLAIIIRNSTTLTSITFPTTLATSVVQAGTTLEISGCTSLTSLTNLSNLNWTTTTGLVTNPFPFSGNALNITFPFGVNSFIPNSITINNNGMSQVNVDATIDSIVNNASKWDNYTSSKSLNISGTNASPTGTYQMPAGNDPIGKDAKEQIYWLVNTKNWTITYT